MGDTGRGRRRPAATGEPESVRRDGSTRRNSAGEERRRELLGRVVDHVHAHGIAGLTLRGLAQAVGSNNRMLLYYFGSLEQLVVEALAEAGRRNRPQDASSAWPPADLLDRTVPLAVRLDTCWRALAEPHQQPFVRLFFGVLGLAAYDRERYGPFLADLSRFWVPELTEAVAGEGVDPAEAELLAYEVLAHWRGLQVQQVASLDFALVDRVRRRWEHAFVERVHEAARRPSH